MGLGLDERVFQKFQVYQKLEKTPPENRAWTGVVGVDGSPTESNELLDMSYILRGNVYIDELNWLPEDARDERGREIDKHDKNSLHVSVVDNHQAFDKKNVFATLRYISQEGRNGSLPAEEEFGIDLGKEDRVEMSRFISRHSESQLQSLGSMVLVSLTVKQLIKTNTVGYAILEEQLIRRIKGMGMSVEAITPYEVLKSYGNTRNCVVRVDGPKSLKRATAIGRRVDDFPYGRFFDIAVNGENEELVAEIEGHLEINKERCEAA